MAKAKPRLWKSLPKEDKERVVRELLVRGYTCAAIGIALGTTKNAVVGYQHTHLPDLTGRATGTHEVVPESVLADLLTKVWPAGETAEVPFNEPPYASPVPRFVEDGGQRTASRHRAKYEMTLNPAEACEHEERVKRCPYKKVLGKTFCALPEHNK